jgi:hypothetical protein
MGVARYGAGDISNFGDGLVALDFRPKGPGSGAKKSFSETD